MSHNWTVEELSHWANIVDATARSFGLQPRQMDFVIVSPDRLIEIQAYNAPLGHAHWSRGKTFQVWQTMRDVKGAGALEVAFNADPCFAALRPDQSFVAQLVIMAHTIAHNDFFANNRWFAKTSPDTILNRLAENRKLVNAYMKRYGEKQVEKVLDAAHAIAVQRPLVGGQDRDWLLSYIIDYSPSLQDWQKDLCRVVENETDHFIWQYETKIMNEGWASLWQKRIVNALPITEEQRFEAKDWYAAITKRGASSAFGEAVNPYHLGFAIFEDLKNRWDAMAEGSFISNEENNDNDVWDGLNGTDKLLQVRSLYSDRRFLQDFLTQEVGIQLGLWRYGPNARGSQMVIVTDTMEEGSFENIRNELMRDCGLGSFPSVSIKDTNYKNRHEWLFVHNWDGRDLDVSYTRLTLMALFDLLGPVWLETRTRKRNAPYFYYFDGASFLSGAEGSSRSTLPR